MNSLSSNSRSAYEVAVINRMIGTASPDLWRAWHCRGIDFKANETTWVNDPWDTVAILAYIAFVAESEREWVEKSQKLTQIAAEVIELGKAFMAWGKEVQPLPISSAAPWSVCPATTNRRVM